MERFGLAYHLVLGSGVREIGEDEVRELLSFLFLLQKGFLELTSLVGPLILLLPESGEVVITLIEVNLLVQLVD